MNTQKEMVLFAHLRQNARMPLTELSRKTGIPVSTIFDKIQEQQKEKLITKHVMLFDFQKLGYTARATILLKTEKENRDKIAEYLQKNINVNTVFRINNGYDFMIECVFKSIRELEQFSEQLETKFIIKAKETYYIIEDVKKEGFFADPLMVKLISAQENLQTVPY